MRNIRRTRAAQREWDYFKIKGDLTDAVSALVRNDHRRATELWRKVLDRNPAEAHASPLALQVLLGLRRFDEAEAMMHAGQSKYPAHLQYAAGLAEVARARGDHEVALQRWAAVRKKFPNSMEGFAAGVEALRALGRLPEAEALAEETMKRFPEEVLGFMEHARIATMRQDWELSLLRWDLVRTKFDHPSGYSSAGHAMFQLGRYEEAEAMLARARIRAPTEAGPFVELGLCAQAKGDIPLALERWNRLAQVFPLHLPSCMTAANEMQVLGATADAERVLREAVDHFPAEPGPIENLGLLLMRRGDTSAAIETFARMHQAFPDNRVAYIREIEALTQAGRLDQAEIVREDQRRRFE